MRWWILLFVLPGNTLEHIKRISDCTEMIREPKNHSEKWLFRHEAVGLLSSCTCSRLLSLYLCCLLLLSVCFAVYSVPASVMNVSTSLAIMHRLYMNTRGSQRKDSAVWLELMLHVGNRKQLRWRIWREQEGNQVLLVCLCSVSPRTPSPLSSLSTVFQ